MKTTIRLILSAATIFILLISVPAAHAIEREDVLECSIGKAGKFVLRSKYDYSLIPIPTFGHGTRITNRQSWEADFISSSGKKSSPPVAVAWNGEDMWGFEYICAQFGLKNGMPIARINYFGLHGWVSPPIPWEKLVLRVGWEPDAVPPDLKPSLEAAGVTYSTWEFTFVVPFGDVLVHEEALNRRGEFSIVEKPIIAVFQSISRDGGKTWSDPIVTKDAKIFEIGRSLKQQSFRAVPTKFNGKRVEKLFPPAGAAQCELTKKRCR